MKKSKLADFSAKKLKGKTLTKIQGGLPEGWYGQCNSDGSTDLWSVITGSTVHF